VPQVGYLREYNILIEVHKQYQISRNRRACPCNSPTTCYLRCRSN